MIVSLRVLSLCRSLMKMIGLGSVSDFVAKNIDVPVVSGRASALLSCVLNVSCLTCRWR